MNTHSLGQAQKRVLVVDDEGTILQIVGGVMRDEGYEVETAEDGVDGLNKFRAHACDLVITDQSMPKMNGETMAAAIHAAAPSVPILMFTGLPSAVQFPERLQAVLEKPFQLDELVHLVRDALEARAA